MSVVIEGKLSHKHHLLETDPPHHHTRGPAPGTSHFLPSPHRRQERQTIAVMEWGVKVPFESNIFPIEEDVDMALNLTVRHEQPCPDLWIVLDKNVQCVCNIRTFRKIEHQSRSIEFMLKGKGDFDTNLHFLE